MKAKLIKSKAGQNSKTQKLLCEFLGFGLVLLGTLTVRAEAILPPARPASQAEVDAGVERRKYVSPATLSMTTLIGTNAGISAATATNIFNYQFNAIGGLTNLSPWTADINGAQHQLTNASKLSIGLNNTNTGAYSTIAGGLTNSITGTNSFIGGGENGTISGYFDFIGISYSDNQEIPGFDGGNITANYSFAGVLEDSAIGADRSFLGIGKDSVVDGFAGAIVGGQVNWIFGSGGSSPTVSTNGVYSFIGGGNANVIGNGSYYDQGHLTHGGANFGVIGGGYDNHIAAGASYSAILGSAKNEVSAPFAFSIGHYKTNSEAGLIALGYRTLGLNVHSNGNVDFTGALTGNGSGLTSVPGTFPLNDVGDFNQNSAEHVGFLKFSVGLQIDDSASATHISSTDQSHTFILGPVGDGTGLTNLNAASLTPGSTAAPFNGVAITNLAKGPVVIASTGVTVTTNTAADTGQKSYTVSANTNGGLFLQSPVLNSMTFVTGPVELSGSSIFADGFTGENLRVSGDLSVTGQITGNLSFANTLTGNGAGLTNLFDSALSSNVVIRVAPSGGDDTAALNAALSVGHEIELSAGTFLLTNSLIIPSDVILKGQGSKTVLFKNSVFSHVLMNSAASTHGTNFNYRISVSDLLININSNSTTTGVAELTTRGNVQFSYARDISLRNLTITNGSATLYAVHLQSVTNAVLDGLNVSVGVDCIHINGGCEQIIVQNSRLACGDDAIAIMPADYPGSGAHRIDDSQNVSVKNVSLWDFDGSGGGGIAFGVGSWTNWASGSNFSIGDVTVNSANIYKVVNLITNLPGSNAPTHTTHSDVTGADGITWRWLQTGTKLNNHVRGVLLQNVSGDSNFSIRCYGDDPAYNRYVYPGTSGAATIGDVLFENVIQKGITAVTNFSATGTAFNITAGSATSFTGAANSWNAVLATGTSPTSKLQGNAIIRGTTTMSNTLIVASGNISLNASGSIITPSGDLLLAPASRTVSGYDGANDYKLSLYAGNTEAVRLSSAAVSYINVSGAGLALGKTTAASGAKLDVVGDIRTSTTLTATNGVASYGGITDTQNGVSTVISSNLIAGTTIWTNTSASGSYLQNNTNTGWGINAAPVSNRGLKVSGNIESADGGYFLSGSDVYVGNNTSKGLLVTAGNVLTVGNIGNTVLGGTNVSCPTDFTAKTITATNLSIIRTNGAVFDVSTTDFVLGTRYTNVNRRATVAGSFTLTAAAAGTATVSLYVEHGTTITNSLQVSAGPLAGMVTVEPLVLSVSPNGFFYFTDETSGVGASAAVKTGKCSITYE